MSDTWCHLAFIYSILFYLFIYSIILFIYSIILFIYSIILFIYSIILFIYSNSEQNARLDVAANGVWGGRFERTFFDVRVFNPFAKSNMDTLLPLLIEDMRMINVDSMSNV